MLWYSVLTQYAIVGTKAELSINYMKTKILAGAVVVWDWMSFRSTLLACIISLMVLGCATNRSASTSDARMWRAQLYRQQLVAREAGRIGYIGNAGPALGSSLPSGHGM
jgi:hypothetical protein